MNHSAKLSLLARYVLRPSQWDEQAEAWSRSLPTDAPGCVAGKMAKMVKAGEAKVCDLVADGERIGFVVFRISAEHVLHVMAAFGRGPDRENLMDVAMPLLDTLARACECEHIRFHTMRPGLIVKAQEQGFRVSEVILRKAVK